METNEVNKALKELLKKAGVINPVDLIDKIVILSLLYNDGSKLIQFAKITRVSLEYDHLGSLDKINLKANSTVYCSVQYTAESKVWKYRELSVNFLNETGSWPAEISFPKKWWQIF